MYAKMETSNADDEDQDQTCSLILDLIASIYAVCLFFI